MERKEILIGIDNGNKFTKTNSKLFLEETSVKMILDDYSAFGKTIITYGDQLYVIGEGRNAVKLNKFDDQDTFLITIAAIAAELYERNIEKDVDVVLGVGLPLMSFSKYKIKMKEYFLKDDIRVEYKRKIFRFNITEVYVYPQAVSAFMTIYEQYKEFQASNVIDIGGYTVDAFVNNNGLPELGTLKSYPLGIITLLEEIKQDLLKDDIKLSDTQIEKIIYDEECFIVDQKSVSIIYNKVQNYVNELINKLKESGMELRNPTVYIGGGSKLLEKCIRDNKESRYVEFLDIYSNARGYYMLMSEQHKKFKERN